MEKLKKLLFLITFIFGSPCFAGSLNDLDLIQTNGERYNVESLKNRTIVVQFWASWCESCREEFEVLEKLNEQYSDKIKILAISADENDLEFKSFIKTTNPNFTVLRCKDGPKCLRQLGGGEKVPYTVLIGPKFEFIASFLGLKSYSEIQRNLKLLGVQSKDK